MLPVRACDHEICSYIKINTNTVKTGVSVHVYPFKFDTPIYKGIMGCHGNFLPLGAISVFTKELCISMLSLCTMKFRNITLNLELLAIA